MISNMVQVMNINQMELHMKENLLMVNIKDLVHIGIWMEAFIKENGVIHLNMVKEFIEKVMIQNIMEIGNLVQLMVKVY